MEFGWEDEVTLNQNRRRNIQRIGKVRELGQQKRCSEIHVKQILNQQKQCHFLQVMPIVKPMAWSFFLKVRSPLSCER